MNNIETIIEHLQEMGKVVLQGNENIAELQAELFKRGYNTRYQWSDREYLVLE